MRIQEQKKWPGCIQPHVKLSNRPAHDPQHGVCVDSSHDLVTKPISKAGIIGRVLFSVLECTLLGII